jgi:hypothetical protein
MGLKLAMGALPRAILTFQLRLRSGFLGVSIYCGAQVDKSACNPKPKSLHQTEKKILLL